MFIKFGLKTFKDDSNDVFYRGLCGMHQKGALKVKCLGI